MFIYLYKVCSFIHGVKKEDILALDRQNGKHVPEHWEVALPAIQNRDILNFFLDLFPVHKPRNKKEVNMVKSHQSDSTEIW